jgi:hypothetical protein
LSSRFHSELLEEGRRKTPQCQRGRWGWQCHQQHILEINQQLI